MVLLISGATGIAEATALLAAGQGASVFIASLEESDCRMLCDRIPGSGYAACDLSDESQAQRAFASCLERFGRLDALFNCAGISGRRFGDGPLHECSAEGWDKTLQVNVSCTFLLCREALRHWLAISQPGAIVNMSSVLAFSPEPRYFATHAYAASKGAIVSLSQAMAAYYAPYSIRVNVIAPGLVKTPMTRRAQSDGEILDFIRDKQPLSHGMLDPEDVARAALFLLGSESRYITGAVLNVDGGWAVG
ncbi:MAG: SDR family oxidoreductase [Candidatus Solibacter usitatus]|nr:SDR family oxidoreductase [Candidatus Solibacter usitatus]